MINVEKLWTLVPKEEMEKHKPDSDVVPVIDTLRHGFGKVLGKGTLTHPFIVKARFVSEKAEYVLAPASRVVISIGSCKVPSVFTSRQKIKEAGGVVSLVA